MNYHELLPYKLDRLNISNILYNDIDCWLKNKINKKIYNKLWLVELQGIECGPIGTKPNKFPIIIKPIINLYGMSRGFKKINSLEEYENNQIDGHFWMPFFEGDNYNYDIIFDDGKIVSYYTLISKPSINGTFEYHKYAFEEKLPKHVIDLLENNFDTYSGPMNIEIIDNNIIEGHLRLNGDCYIYDDDFFINLSNLINKKPYKFNEIKKNIYLFPYFINPYYFEEKYLNKQEIEEILLNKKCNLVCWDDIHSNYQRNDLNRLLMYVTSDQESGEIIRFLITENLTLREKIYPYIS